MRPLAALCLALWMCPGAAASTNTRPPDFKIARQATRTVFDTYLRLTESSLVIGPCAHRGEHSTVCRARITGPEGAWTQRYRVVVTTRPTTLSVAAYLQI